MASHKGYTLCHPTYPRNHLEEYEKQYYRNEDFLSTHTLHRQSTRRNKTTLMHLSAGNAVDAEPADQEARMVAMYNHTLKERVDKGGYCGALCEDEEYA